MHAAKADPSLLQSATKTETGERFNRTLFSALDALMEDGIEYSLIGGVASSGMGRPRSTHDIDIFVRPEDAGAALNALARHGFRTEKTDPAWLFKGFKEDILVDIIFKSRGDIYFDRDMWTHSNLVEFHGREVRTVNPVDLIIIKCAVHDEIGPHHWHDALAILSHATVDWDYMLKRARKAPRRLLALLLYAQSNDIWIPNKVVFELFRVIYGDSSFAGSADSNLPPMREKVVSISRPAPVTVEQRPSPQPPPQQTSTEAAKSRNEKYVSAKIKDALAQDPRTGEQDIKVHVEGDRVLLRGEVTSEERRLATLEVARDCAPGYKIESQIKVSDFHGPEGVEEVR